MIRFHTETDRAKPKPAVSFVTCAFNRDGGNRTPCSTLILDKDAKAALNVHNLGRDMIKRFLFLVILVAFVQSCGGGARTTNGDAVGGPGVIVNRYENDGEVQGTIEDGNPDDLFELDGYFYRTRQSPRQTTFPAPVRAATQCVVPPNGSCYMQVPVPVGSSCYCTFPNGFYANGYAN